jgi:hypothetical protein
MHFPREQTNKNRPPVGRRAAVDENKRRQAYFHQALHQWCFIA